MADTTYSFTKPAIDKIATVVHRVLGEPIDQAAEPSRQASYGRREFWATIGANNTTAGTVVTAPIHYAWQQDPDSGNESGNLTATNPTTYATEVNNSSIVVPSGTWVRMVKTIHKAFGATEVSARYQFAIPLPNVLVPCTIQDDGTGAQPGMTGGADNYATFKYHCFDLQGNKIGNSMTPSKPRPPGYMKQAPNGSYGIGIWANGFQLWDAGETYDLGTCPTSDSDT